MRPISKRFGQAQIDFVAAILVVGVFTVGLMTLAPAEMDTAMTETFKKVKTDMGFPEEAVVALNTPEEAEAQEQQSNNNSYEEGFYQSTDENGLAQQGQESGQNVGLLMNDAV